MNVKSIRWQPKRMGAMAVAAAMLLHTVVPAHAVVSQLPGLYTTPPPANVMFTLDDSGSMQSDAIPDIPDSSYTGLTTPGDTSSFFFYYINGRNPRGGVQRLFPDMWGQNSEFLSPTYYAKANPLARYLRSSAGNPLYYDPAVTYLPWPSSANDSTLSANASTFPGTATATQVRINASTPFSGGYLLDIKTRVNASGGAGGADNEANNYWPATYFVYTGSTALPTATPNVLLNATFSDPNLFTKVEIKPSVATYAKAATRTDCGASSCSYDQELQNFGNWLQYYRGRALMAKGGVATAFAKQGTNLRVGFASINSNVATTATAGGVVRRGVSLFTGAARTAFYDDLYPLDINGGTPLRQAMDDVGKYFQRTGAGNPWAEDPAARSVGTEYSCRKSVHIMSTDGFWNGAGASTPADGNNDAFSGNTPPKGGAGGKTYAFSDAAPAVTETDSLVGRFTINPFADGNSAQLSDVAAYYWRNDLRTDLNNDVSSSTRDPAFWQHLSTYTVGLGVSGTGTVRRASDASTVVPASEPATSPFFPHIGTAWLATQQMRDLIVSNKVALTWPLANGNDPATGDDLIHASMSGRGRYLSATNPTQLAAGLSAVLAEATDNPGSLASIVTESPQVSTSTEVYQATYNPNQWFGRLYAFSQSASGAVNTTPSTALWEASNKMPAPASRNIYTWNPGTNAGSTFTWGGLTGTQQGNLGNDSTILDYLRGSNAKEVAKGGPFRDRSRYTVGGVTGGVLGDIVNGSPIKGPSAGGGYDKLPSGTAGQSSYATYRADGNTALDNMRDSIFVGANDGMLHAFNRNTGAERFAFVPNSVFSVPRSPTAVELKLKMLSDPGYTHRFTVDGPPQVGDAFVGPSLAASTWKTLLLGSTGAGARSVFSMDISNPAVGVGGFDQGKIMWEFSDANNADMGYVVGYPHIARMRDGTWVSIFGNGYDSANGQAKLFILNLQTGAVLWEQSVGAAGGNGLSQPNFTVNDKREVTAIYAGDLKGNLWRFDVDDANPANWKVAFGTGPNYIPLYAGNANQPITVMPEISLHPSGGRLLSFGTGKLFDSEDTAAAGNVNLNTQTIYGIWDKPGETTGFSGTTTLVAQAANTSLVAATDTSANLTGTTNNPVDWATKRGWYMNLTSGGERVNVNPQQVRSTLLVVANKPDTNLCSSGGSSRLFALNPITGGAPDFGVFNSNGDATINNADRGYNVKSIASVVLSLPTLQTKRSVVDKVVTELSETRGQTAARLGGVEDSAGRRAAESRAPTKAECEKYLSAGGSNATIEGVDLSVCKTGVPRISWRQIK